MSRTVRLFILLSVVLNVVLIGFTAGRGCNRHEIKRGDHIIELLDRSSLPEVRRAELKEKLGAALPSAERRKAKRQLHREAVAVLEAEEFDAAAYRAHLDKMLVDRDRHKQRMVEVMVEIASELNQEERKALAKIFRRASRFKNPHK